MPEPEPIKGEVLVGVHSQNRPRGSGPEVAPLVCKDIEDRAAKGEKSYGERLKAFNGRDPLIDLYQELLDACMYLRQLLAERYDG